MKLADYLETTNQIDFAARCGVSQPAVSQWVNKGVPFGKVRIVFEASAGQVTPHDCFPNTFPVGFQFPPEPETKVAAA